MLKKLVSILLFMLSAAVYSDQSWQALNWVSDQSRLCGGFYLEPPFIYSPDLLKNNLIQINSDQGVFSPQSTSTLEGNVTVNRYAEQITANKVVMYRDPTSHKLIAINLTGQVHLREPENLVIAQSAYLDLKNKTEKVSDLLYRMTVYSNFDVRAQKPGNEALQKPRAITQLTGWGHAARFEKNHPKIFDLYQATYTTCPPDTSIWHVSADKIHIDKISGRGTAHGAKLYIKKIPVFYTPFLNFPIDSRRQTGFLWPPIGVSSKTGPYVALPFYWNIAPNYDSTITPILMEKRGVQLNDTLRYLTPRSNGQLRMSVLPQDRAFNTFLKTNSLLYQNSVDPIKQAQLRKLQHTSTTRSAIAWQHSFQINNKWSTNVDYNYVSDDYYLNDLRHNLNEVTENQLLQEADLNYRDAHWNFITRVQQYQTLHPINVTTNFLNQYSRFPQLILEGNYPDQPFGFNYFTTNEFTHFDYRNTPGDFSKHPMGNRINLQPGISLPFSLPYFYITPRLQFALTKYELGHVSYAMPKTSTRALPIFDVSLGMYFDRHINLFKNALEQTLEPQISYTYIPYRDQNPLPLFDTTINTLTYDQLFNYNRFSGIDRIGDANQITIGVATRLINSSTGFEQLRFGLGEIFYFTHRRVSLCMNNQTTPCPDVYTMSDNKTPRSPLSGTLIYNLTNHWAANASTIWNTSQDRLDNQNIGVQYSLDSQRIINLNYSYIRRGDIQANLPYNSNANNLKQTDLSFVWPLTSKWSVLGRWTKNINRDHLQNLLYGLQYNSCCWATRFIGGKTFSGLNPNNTTQYNTEYYIEFALKGLATFNPKGDPAQTLANINGYVNNFGKDF